MNVKGYQPTDLSKQPDPSHLPREEDLFTALPPWDEQFYQPVNPIKECALANAVELCKSDPDVRTGEVLTVAADFEAYLLGEDPSTARPPGHGAAPDPPGRR